MHIHRLLKLAHHLKFGVLGHQKFNFAMFNANDLGEDIREPYCGTQGCAIGECPILFPKEWTWNQHGVPVLNSSYYGSDVSVVKSTMTFFDLCQVEEYYHLFQPNHQLPGRYGGLFLDYSATKDQVSDNILAFIVKLT